MEACGHTELSFEPFVACVDVEVCLRGEACRREVVIVGTARCKMFCVGDRVCERKRGVLVIRLT